jgi:hypothetical protein
VAWLLFDQCQRQQLEVALRQHAPDAEPVAPPAAAAFAMTAPARAFAKAAETPPSPKLAAATAFGMSQSMHFRVLHCKDMS